MSTQLMFQTTSPALYLPEVDALGPAVLADVALARRVRQVHPQHLGVAAAGDEGGAETQEHPAQVQHEPVRHVALAQHGAHLVRPHLAAARVGPEVVDQITYTEKL